MNSMVVVTFTHNKASIVMNFNEDGIETIAIDGVTKKYGH